MSRIRKKEDVKQLEQKIIALDKTGRLAQNLAFRKIFSDTSLNARLRAMNDFIEKFPHSRFSERLIWLKLRITIARPGITEDSVLAVFKSCLDNDSSAFRVWEILSSNYYLKIKQDYDRAIHYARLGYQHVPPEYKGYMLEIEGWAQYQKEQFATALNTLLRADSLIENTNYAVQYRIGAAYFKTGQIDSALYYLGKSLVMREKKDTRRMFTEVYRQKYGSLAGMGEYINRWILSFAAVPEPYPAPDFTLTDLENRKVRLSDHLGKVILIHFWKPG